MGDRFNEGKPKFSKLPLQELEGAARVFEKGEAKYGRVNYQKGLETVGIYDSLLRHVIAMQYEEKDAETGELHLDHAICNLLMLRWMIHNHPDLHNLYPDSNVVK